ncbi:MAG TPA: alpha/beta fold hydrolase [Acidimicrobiales bacterium]
MADRRRRTGPVGGGPRWFGSPATPLFGWVHEPSGAGGHGPGSNSPGSNGAVVLCRPLFGEDTVADASYRQLARSLSAAGLWVVRFDYAATGDSGTVEGGPSVAAWLDSVDRAIDVARLCTTGPVALCGLRMGALLAAAAAGRREDVDAVVLWDPCRTGRDFLRRQQALQAGRFADGATDGVLEVPGHVLGRPLARELAALTVPSALRARRALVVARPGEPTEARFAGPDGTGPVVPADVVLAGPGEQEALLDVDPLTCREPAGAIAGITGWLGRTMVALAAAGRRETGRLAGPAATAGPVEPVWTRPGSTRVAVDDPGAEAPGLVTERVVRLGDVGLFAVETSPAAPETGKVVVFLSSGLDRHTGPSRLWVTLARRWAADGVRCVRVDLSGLGESPARRGQAEQVLRAPEAFDDVRQVVDAAAGDAGDVVLVGLCSGGYQALESALELSPGGVLAVNPLLRFTPPELLAGGVVDPRRRLCVPKRPWVGAVRARVPERLAGPVAALRGRWPGTRLVDGGSWLAELADAGVDVYGICGEQEAQLLGPTGAGADAGGPAEPDRSASAGAPTVGPPRIEIVPGLDHALLPAAQRALVCDRLSDELARMVGRRPAVVGAVDR